MSDTSIPAPKDPLSVGDQVLDRYRVTERLAIGGHSIVYRGDDKRLSRPVCIKVFHNIAESDGVWRASYEHFVQEAFALSKLTHPNTLRIYDFGHLDPDPDTGSDEGAPFQVSEFMNGGTLSRLVRREGPLSTEESATIINALSGALSEAHDAGIVHRDIKPQNILFARSPRARTVKLADFGIAKSRPLEDDERGYWAGDTAVVAGEPLLLLSPTWAAPEQMRGDPVGPATDIYSLALITIFMLTGRAAFAAPDRDDAFRRRIDSHAEIEAVLADTDLPGALVPLLQRATNYDIGERPLDVDQFGRDLVDALSGRREPVRHLSPVPDPPVRFDSPPAAPLQRRPPPQPLRLADGTEQPLGSRRGRFVAAPAGTADATSGQTQVRFTLLPTGDRFCLHVKGLNCFVSLRGGRASRAVQLYGAGDIVFMLPNQQPIGHARVSFGTPAAGHTVFEIAGRAVALSLEECPLVIAVDFGEQADCLFVYQPPRVATPSKRSRRRH